MSRRRLPASSMEVRHASLLQDFVQLKHEFEKLNEQLDNAKLEKAKLLAEVRFLRRRFKMLKLLRAQPNESKRCMSCNSTEGRQSLHDKLDLPEPCKTTVAGNPSSLAKCEAGLSSEQFTNSTSGLEEFPKINEKLSVRGLNTALKEKSSKSFVSAVRGKRKIRWQDQIYLQCN